jgi:hypothetical protein
MVIKRRYWFFASLLGILSLGACSPAASEVPLKAPTIVERPDPTHTILRPTEEVTVDAADTPVTLTEAVDLDPTNTPEVKNTIPASQADVVSVSMSGESGAYNFSVTISSPDEGCSQYADWWEIVSQDGELIYRRILLHSHVDEQPFTRSGGPVSIEVDTIVLVRAHMHPGGYGGTALKGSLEQGFEQVELSADFAADLVETLPLPEGCNF